MPGVYDPAEATPVLEVLRLYDLIEEFAAHCDDYGWSNLAAELRRRRDEKPDGLRFRSTIPGRVRMPNALTAELKTPENMSDDAMRLAVEQLKGKAPLPVYALRNRRREYLAGWATLTHDDDGNTQAEIELLGTPKGEELRQLIDNQTPRLGFGIAGRILERDGDTIHKVDIHGVDFLGLPKE